MISLFRFLLALLATLVSLIPGLAGATVVRMHTSLGIVDVRLYDTGAPVTVANFLTYVGSGAYTDSFIHRSDPGFVIQGGGYALNGNVITAVTARPAIVNEFSAARSNLRGTIAMAKVGNNPDSATSQWFFNLADNSANLDKQNGGFTVFGQVIGEGMRVVDAIAGLSTLNFGGDFSTLPVIPPVSANGITCLNLVLLSAISVGNPTTTSSSDRIFAYLESLYPQYIAPANSLTAGPGVSQTADGYYYRYYATNAAFVATANGNVYYLGPASGNQILLLGSVADWLSRAAAAGY